ncbi:carbohydrate-binding module family 21 protein, partial [Serpula lacrymans var. lacrymans S7.3]
MPALPSKVANVALQSLELIQDTRTINGRVRVRNIAFEKWLAVRFTFDWWQTTSEVTARYAESVEGNTFDIFTFTIRLHDIWTRIEEKTLFVALKYIVGGQEFWDNNDGENYLVKFSKSQMAPEVARADEPKSDMVYLRNQLEQVVKGRDRETRRRSSGSGQRMPAVLTANTPLATRYDFGASLKHPWKGGVPPSPPRHLRTSTYPS